MLGLWRRAAHGSSISDDAAGLTCLIERDDAALLLAVADGEIVGTVIVGWDGWRGHLYRLAVAPELRRRGIATALLLAAERAPHRAGRSPRGTRWCSTTTSGRTACGWRTASTRRRMEPVDEAVGEGRLTGARISRCCRVSSRRRRASTLVTSSFPFCFVTVIASWPPGRSHTQTLGSEAVPALWHLPNMSPLASLVLNAKICVTA